MGTSPALMAFVLFGGREHWHAYGWFCLERGSPERKELAMSPSPRLEMHRTILQQQVLPAYQDLGSLCLVYLLGSLVSGYTEDANLDVMMVWNDVDVPAASLREPLVARFDERQGVSPFVVDYHDIHLERYVIAGQEYNVAHQTQVSFEAILQVILDGRRDDTERVLDPLVATAGFSYGELVLDREALGQQWKSRLSAFPPAVKQECQRAVLAYRQAYLTDLTTLMRRADWFKFHCLLIEALRTTMRALFALHEVYYPGDKWLRQEILRFGLGEEETGCLEAGQAVPTCQADYLFAKEYEPVPADSISLTELKDRERRSAC